MSKIYCPSHKEVVLVRMHINPNQATKYGIPFSTKYWFCHKCDAPYEVYPKKAMVLLTTRVEEKKKPRKERSDKGVRRTLESKRKRWELAHRNDEE